MDRTGEFPAEIEYKGWAINVTVEYTYHEGRGGSDDPRYVELLQVIDGTGSDVLAKLDSRTVEWLKDRAYDKEL